VLLARGRTALQLGQARQAVHSCLGHSRTPTYTGQGMDLWAMAAEGRDVGCSVVDQHSLLGALNSRAPGNNAVPHFAWFTVAKKSIRSCQGRDASRGCWREVNKEGCLPGLYIVQCTLGQPFRRTGCKHRHALPKQHQALTCRLCMEAPYPLWYASILQTGASFNKVLT